MRVIVKQFRNMDPLDNQTFHLIKTIRHELHHKHGTITDSVYFRNSLTYAKWISLSSVRTFSLLQEFTYLCKVDILIIRWHTSSTSILRCGSASQPILGVHVLRTYQSKTFKMSFQKETWLSTSVTDSTSHHSWHFTDLPILKFIFSSYQSSLVSRRRWPGPKSSIIK